MRTERGGGLARPAKPACARERARRTLTPLRRSGPATLALLVGCASAEVPPSVDDDGGLGRTSAPLVETPETGASLPPGYLSLTYDDGPGYATEPIAAFLEDEGIPATFFVNACRITGVGAP